MGSGESAAQCHAAFKKGPQILLWVRLPELPPASPESPHVKPTSADLQYFEDLTLHLMLRRSKPGELPSSIQGHVSDIRDAGLRSWGQTLWDVRSRH